MLQDFILRNGVMSLGGMTFPYAAKTANYTLNDEDYFIDCTSNTFTVTLPTAVGRTGQIYVIKNSGTGTITVATTSAQTIDGVSTKSLIQYISIVVESTGSNWAVSGGAGAGLNAIYAATATQTGIANGNFGIRWNWARTTDTTSALELGETTAATGGTSTSGVPNQVGLKLSTLAASTMSPLSVYSRGSHVFSVSPSVAQILAATGTAAAPAWSFASNTNTGMVGVVSSPAAGLGFSVSGLTCMVIGSSILHVLPGSAAFPGLRDTVNQTTGLAWNLGATRSLSVEDNTIGTIARFISDGSNTGTSQLYQAFATTTGALLQGRKSRGTVASPTVITTGDNLLTISGFGYVGATNTYLEASRIVFDSTGTISDTSTGIGGKIDFLTRDVGGAVTSKFTMTNKGELLVAGSAGATGQVLTSAGSGAAPTWSAPSSAGNSIFLANNFGGL